jgi:hypothetical protein
MVTRLCSSASYPVHYACCTIVTLPTAEQNNTGLVLPFAKLLASSCSGKQQLWSGSFKTSWSVSFLTDIILNFLHKRICVLYDFEYVKFFCGRSLYWLITNYSKFDPYKS